MSKAKREDKEQQVQWMERVRAAILYVENCELPERHRATIDRALRRALQNAADRIDEVEAVINQGSPWSSDDMEILKELFPSGKKMTWKEQFDSLDTAEARLQRSSESIKQRLKKTGLWTCSFD